jgi:predicted outer membrane lipoprotein
MRVLGLLLTVAFASAAAAPMERVQVGVKGRNATRVDVPVGDYTSAKFDGEQGDWQGPAYTATQSATTGRSVSPSAPTSRTTSARSTGW